MQLKSYFYSKNNNSPKIFGSRKTIPKKTHVALHTEIRHDRKFTQVTKAKKICKIDKQ